MDTKDLKLEEGDQVYLLQTKQDVDELLGPEEDFYAKKRENVNDPDLNKLLEEYKDVFREELPREPPTKRNVEHEIILEEGTKPIQAHQYQLSPNHLQTIQETVAELLQLGHIKSSKSPW
jgi:hypothetical protein